MLNITIQTTPPVRNYLAACLVLLCAGCVTVLSFAPLSIWVLYPLAQALLFSLWYRAASRYHAFGLGVCFGLGAFSGVGWLMMPLAQLSGWFAVAGFLLTLCVMLLLALMIGLVGFLSQGSRRFWLLLPWLWALQEWVRSLIFPWLLSGYSHALPHHIFFALSPVIGVLGLGWYQAFMIVLCLGVVYRLYPLRLLLFWCLMGLAALLVMSVHWVRSTTVLPMDVLQTRVPSFLKWRGDRSHEALVQYDRLMHQTRVDALVILPETALPWVVHDSDVSMLPSLFAIQRDLLLGVPYVDAQAHLYNAALLLTKTGVTMRYNKRHLVPFGEYFPDALSWMRRWLPIPMSSFTAGDAYQPLIRWHTVPLAILLCFEDVFPEEFRHQASLAGVLINMTNDDWFHPSWMQAQHLQMAQMTATMLGRPLLRVSNGTLSAAIDAEGRVIDRIDMPDAAVLHASVPFTQGTTPFVLLGHRLWIVLAFLGWLSQWVMRLKTIASVQPRWSWRSLIRRHDRPQ